MNASTAWSTPGAAAALLAGLLWVFPIHADMVPDEAPGLSAAEEREAQELDLGRRVFYRKCKNCHGSGREGAPVVGRPGEWSRRLAQPTEVLIEHAIEGHQGSRGRMPPKGDFESLSDAEVAAAVRFIVARGEWLQEQLEKRRTACIERSGESSCTPVQASDLLLLELLWTLRSASGNR